MSTDSRCRLGAPRGVNRRPDIMKTNPDFLYVTYIAATPEQLWRALTDTDITREYWVGVKAGSPVHVNVSDWRPGSRWEHQRLDETHTADVVGRVVESDPPRRLVFTWARPKEADDASKHSRVAFEIEPQDGGIVRLTVRHDDLARDPKMLEGITGGWPQVLSNLKTFLETGRALTPSVATR
jgi:uncharacterized protein YndB with AHSA1/START domain